jgi:hypothetical protein
MKLPTTFKKNLPDLRYIFLLFLSTRLGLTLIGVVSRSILELQSGKEYNMWSQQLWLDLWGVWDSFWYIDIAEQGYSDVGRNPLDSNQANYAFFPLYPLLMRGLGMILGNDYFLAGVIISNLCLLVACYFLCKLVQLNSDRETSLRSVKFLLLSPTAFIFSGVFTESLYVMLAIFCFYFAQKRQWLLAGVAGFFLSLSRSVGVLILIPLLYEYLKSKNFQLKAIKYDILFLLLIPLGLALFAIYNHQLTGDYLAFTKIQSAWNRTLNNPISTLIGAIRRGLAQEKIRPLIEASFSIGAIALLLGFFRKFQVSYWLFSLYSIFIPLLTGIDSMPRYLLPIFPLYILIAQLTRNPELDQVYTILFALLQGGLSIFWFCGYNLLV